MSQNTKKNNAFAAVISSYQNNANIDCTNCASDVSKTREINAFSAAMACFRNSFSLFCPSTFTYDTQIKEQCKRRLQKMCNRCYKTRKNNAFVAAMACLQKPFLCCFVQAHLLTTLKWKKNASADCRNCASDAPKTRKSNDFAAAMVCTQFLQMRQINAFVGFHGTEFICSATERVDQR